MNSCKERLEGWGRKGVNGGDALREGNRKKGEEGEEVGVGEKKNGRRR